VWSFLTVACAEPVHVHLTTGRGEGLLDADERETATLDDGFGFWGREWKLVELGQLRGDQGVVQVRMFGWVLGGGLHLPEGDCFAKVWTTFDGNALAHELGHIWGLEHVDDLDNLMVEERAGDDLTEAQWETAEKRMRRFGRCR
jgi:hypothetical protein